jgi:hypothetical protein
MIEYSIEELKYYYSNCNNYSDTDIKSINYLEDTLSDIIDDEHTNNCIYHIFPSIAFIAFSSFMFSIYNFAL